MLTKLDAIAYMSFFWLKTGSSVGSREHYKKPSGSLRVEEVLEQLKH
jgi:hypothetical protein